MPILPYVAGSAPPPLTAISLFAGIGGIDLALGQAGIPTIAAVEIAAAARGVLATHFPDTQCIAWVTRRIAATDEAMTYGPHK